MLDLERNAFISKTGAFCFDHDGVNFYVGEEEF